MTRSRSWKTELSSVETRAAGRFLTLPAEIRQRIYSYTFDDSIIVRSHINPSRRTKPASLCDYPNSWRDGCEGDFYDWLLLCATDKNLLLTCKAIYNDALASYLSLSTLNISLCQLANTPSMSRKHLLHIRNISLDEEDESHLEDDRLVKEAICVLRQFSHLESLRVPVFDHLSNVRDDWEPNRRGLRNAILAETHWGIRVGELAEALPQTRISFATFDFVTVKDLKVRIAASKNAVQKEKGAEADCELVARPVEKTEPERTSCLDIVSDGSPAEEEDDCDYNAATGDESATESEDDHGHHRYEDDDWVFNVVSTVLCWRCGIY